MKTLTLIALSLTFAAPAYAKPSIYRFATRASEQANIKAFHHTAKNKALAEACLRGADLAKGADASDSCGYSVAIGDAEGLNAEGVALFLSDRMPTK